ncbi:MAG: hypothetical protein AAGI66_08160 [Cyanobacteria bacterium P01_H01_bin.74]
MKSLLPDPPTTEPISQASLPKLETHPFICSMAVNPESHLESGQGSRPLSQIKSSTKESQTAQERAQPGKNKISTWQSDGLNALFYALLIPVIPFLAYFLLDKTGVSLWLVQNNIIPKVILGEGFGHVAFCFSIHYCIQSIQYLLTCLKKIASVLSVSR